MMVRLGAAAVAVASVGRMSLAMTVAERQAFLAQVHVAVLAVAGEDGRAPLAVPVWYDYRPGGEPRALADRDYTKLPS
jgi:hypothetical protein